MSTKSFLHEVMSLAWQFVRKNGFTMSEALKCAWANMKLKLQMKSKIVKFYFQKVDGSVREAYGTLFLQRFGFRPQEKYIKGEVLSDMVERVD